MCPTRTGPDAGGAYAARMALLRRRPVPAVVRDVALDPGDRRVAWALTPDGAPVVATELGLHLPGRDRLDWAAVEKAVWRRPVLTVTEVAEVEGAGAAYDVELAGDADLPEAVRTRVTASVAWSSHTRLHPSGGVRVVGRRRPGAEVLSWQLVYDRGTDPDDPLVREQAESLLLASRRTVG